MPHFLDAFDPMTVFALLALALIATVAILLPLTARERRRRAMADLRRRRRSGDARVALLESRHAEALAARDSAQDAALRGRDDAHADRLGDLRAAHDRRLHELRAAHAAEVAALQNMLDKLGHDPDPAATLAACRYLTRPLLDAPHAALLASLQETISASGGSGHVFAGLPYAALLAPDPRHGGKPQRARAATRLRAAICDAVVTDAAFRPLAVVELRGDGSTRPDALARMQIREAIRARSPLAVIDVPRGPFPAHVGARIAALLAAARDDATDQDAPNHRLAAE